MSQVQRNVLYIIIYYRTINDIARLSSISQSLSFRPSNLARRGLEPTRRTRTHLGRSYGCRSQCLSRRSQVLVDCAEAAEVAQVVTQVGSSVDIAQIESPSLFTGPVMVRCVSTRPSQRKH